MNNLSLRDYFAGQFLAGAAGAMLIKFNEEGERGATAREMIVEVAYAMSDAMIKARQKTEGEK